MMSATMEPVRGAFVGDTPDVQGQKVAPLVNKARFGRRVAAARSDAGYSSRPKCIAALRSQLDFEMAGWALGSIERGERLPEADELAALALLLDPPGGIHYFYLPSMPAELAKRFVGMNCGD
jgi:hypothetical protein